jgi:hypothetical protein
MIRLNNSINLINPSNIIDYFAMKGRNLDLLSNCNFQDFKYIDGCGEGYFLVSYGSISSHQITMNMIKGLTNYSRSLIITDSVIFEADNSPKLQLIKTVELKYLLESTTATRNYNVIDHKTVKDNKGGLLLPDDTDNPKTVVQIIKDIDPSVEVVWNTISIRPYNLFVDGLSLREIIDRICQCYCLLWTAEYSIVDVEGTPTTTVTIYVYPGTALTPTPTGLPTDVNNIKPVYAAKDITTVYPILTAGLQKARVYYKRETTTSGGKSTDVYVPYFPAIFEPGTDTINNDTNITTVHDYVRANIYNLSKLENYYFVHSHIEPYSHLIAPKALKYTYGHNGQGLKTILYSGKYPVLSPSEHSKRDRQALNVVGKLTYAYKGLVEGFFVTALYGIDGYIEEDTELYVINLYKWDYGAINAKVRIEWDFINHRWIPLQQEYVCPPSTSVPALPAPPEEEIYPPLTM